MNFANRPRHPVWCCPATAVNMSAELWLQHTKVNFGFSCSACGRVIARARVLRRAVALLRPGAEAELAHQRRHLLGPSPDLVLDLVGLHVHERTGAQPGQEALEPGAPAGQRRLRLATAAAVGRRLGRRLADRHVPEHRFSR